MQSSKGDFFSPLCWFCLFAFWFCFFPTIFLALTPNVLLESWNNLGYLNNFKSRNSERGPAADTLQPPWLLPPGLLS